MSNTFNEYVVRGDGTCLVRSVTESDLSLEQSVFDKMADGTPRQMRNIFTMEDWGIVHASVLPSATFLTVPLIRLPLRAPFKLVGEKKSEQVLVPVFSSKTDPVFAMDWEPLADMKLALLCAAHPAKSNRWEASGAWLFATSNDGNHWRLPLPNIHDNCGICEGDMWERTSDTLRGALRLTLDQFQKSQWNADLWKDAELTQRMFRFKPKKEGFEVLPMDGEKDWTKFCMKVSVDATKHLIY